MLPVRKTVRISRNQLPRDIRLGATKGGTNGREDSLLEAPFRLKIVPSMILASRFSEARAFLLRCRGIAIDGSSGLGLVGDI